MTGLELEGLVDKLAEKTGVAVGKLQPVAEEVVRQYVLQAWVQFGIALTVFITALVTFLWILQYARHFKSAHISGERIEHWYATRDGDGPSWMLGLFFASLLCLVISFFVSCHAVQCAIAPLPHLLGIR